MNPELRLPKVVITHWVHDEVIRLLEQSCCVVPNIGRSTLPRDEVLRRCSDADAVMVFMPDRVDEEFLSLCPRLKVIGAALKGYDNFDVAACERHDVRFSIVRDLLTEPTAELAVALLLAMGRNLPPGDRMVRSGEFHGWRPVLYGKGLSGSTVGIIGMGAIGRAVAKRLQGFGCRLVYSDPLRLKPEVETGLGLALCHLGELLSESDFVLVAAPLTPQTRHIINSETLGGMKTGAYLVNVGRGSVVDEAAVAEALGSNRLAGYAADVFEFEDWARADRPLGIHPDLLADHGKTVFTPHLGSAVDGVRREIELETARSILSVLHGED
ncbi:MAG: phosphonate dehydrogenase [Oryzomonas sp.]|uniref:phosphonate dehydrogenase n=1 Tax=Oryzomonas sp. TaxID=2855186 RepID=UPI002844B4C5|nr:phosphonate dehydrogenase [Oryzomonas sp.]MDR3581248.1 phosphonate dehydrogenase [Oryzomonas sp.]